MENTNQSQRLVPINDLQWFDCVVDGAGPGEDGTIWVRLTSTDGEFTEVWFTALPAIRQQVLETALAALQSQLVCGVGLTGTSDGSQIYRIQAFAPKIR
jgi:hypothetical protein